MEGNLLNISANTVIYRFMSKNGFPTKSNLFKKFVQIHKIIIFMSHVHDKCKTSGQIEQKLLPKMKTKRIR